MIPENHLNVLHLLNEKLQGINWVITRSTAFIIQGIAFPPNDIDIQTTKEGAYQIEKRLAHFVKKKVKFLSTDTMRSHYGVLEIRGIPVEIMGDIQKKVNGDWEPPVNINEHKRYVPINRLIKMRLQSTGENTSH